MGKLTDIISEMLTQAQTVPHAVHRKLARGLHIAIHEERDNWHVSISRDSEYPSGKEWETVFKHWPYYTPIPEPTQFTDSKNRPALRGRIRKRHMIQLDF